MTLSLNTSDQRVAVKVVFRGEDADTVYSQIAAEKSAINGELALALEWDPHPEKVWRTIRVTHSCNPTDRTSWPQTIDWLATQAAQVHKAFSRRLMKLEAVVSTA
jgi:hypothetical protein